MQTAIDPDLLTIVRALARAAARSDHDAENKDKHAAVRPGAKSQ